MALSTLGSVFLQSNGGGGAGIAFLLIMLIFGVIFVLLPLAGMWKVFQKAGKPGWGAIIPIYNIWLMIEIADREAWWLIVILFIGLALIIPLIDLAEKFGKGAGYGLGLYFLPFIFWPLLGFGDAQFQG